MVDRKKTGLLVDRVSGRQEEVRVNGRQGHLLTGSLLKSGSLVDRVSGTQEEVRVSGSGRQEEVRVIGRQGQW